MADLAKKKEKKIVVPVKPTINLYTPVKLVDPGKLAIILGIVLVLGAIAAKFGVLDPLAKRTDALNKQSAAQQQLSSINLKLTEYPEVESKFGRYSYGWMTDAEGSMLPKEEALDVIESIIAPSCTIENISINQNTLSLSVRGATLDEAREVVKTLNADARVKSAFVYSIVTSDETQKGKISMTVVFVKPVETEKGE